MNGLVPDAVDVYNSRTRVLTEEEREFYSASIPTIVTAVETCNNQHQVQDTHSLCGVIDVRHRPSSNL